MDIVTYLFAHMEMIAPPGRMNGDDGSSFSRELERKMRDGLGPDRLGKINQR